MGEYAAWEVWIHNNIPIVVLVTVMGFAAFSLLFKRHLNLYTDFSAKKEQLLKELGDKKEQVENSQIIRLVDRIEILVDQNRLLFAKQDAHAERFLQIDRRFNRVEVALGVQATRCSERERTLDQQIGGHRVSDPLATSMYQED